jgi:hypothetical protein
LIGWHGDGAGISHPERRLIEFVGIISLSNFFIEQQRCCGFLWQWSPRISPVASTTGGAFAAALRKCLTRKTCLRTVPNSRGGFASLAPFTVTLIRRGPRTTTNVRTNQEKGLPMLEVITSAQIKHNAYYTFNFSGSVYQLVMGISEFYLQDSSNLFSLQDLSISIREVARGPNSVTIQPIMHMKEGANQDAATSSSYVVVTALAVTQQTGNVQVNSALQVADKTSANFNLYLQSPLTKQPIVAGFRFAKNGGNFDFTVLSFSVSLGNSTDQSIAVQSSATMTTKSSSTTCTTDTGLILNADPTFDLARFAPDQRLQKNSVGIDNFDDYKYHVAFLVSYTVTIFNDYPINTFNFMSLAGQASIVGKTVYGEATCQAPTNWSQVDTQSGVNVVVLSWN